MAIMPSSGRWPRRTPDTEQAYFYVDNRNPTTDQFDRVGPYIGNLIPANGQLQVPSSMSKNGEAIMTIVDARLWLPLESGVKTRSIVTNVLTNASFTVVYVQRWSDQ